MDKCYLVNEDGLVIKEIEDPEKYIELQYGDKVVRKGVLQYLSETTDIRYHFVKVNPIVYGKVANKYPILNNLIGYIGYMDNVLQFRNGKPLKTKNLPQICNCSITTIKRQLKGLIEDDIIHKVNTKLGYIFMLNPYIALRGRKVYLTLYDEFKNSALRAEIEEWQK